MDSSVKVSILSTCYNKSQFLDDFFNSVLSQDYKNFEIIIVDDASTDNSMDVIRSFNDDRIKVVALNERVFCSSAYAVALKEATGDICGVVDSDDSLRPNAISEVIRAYSSRNKLEWIYTQHYWCNKDLKVPRHGISSLPERGMSMVEMAIVKKKHCYSHWRTFKTSLRDRGIIFPDGLKCAVDKYMGYALEELGHGGFLNKPLYNYRFYSGNMTSTTSEQKQTWFQIAREFRDKRKSSRIKVFPVVKI